MIKKQSQKEEKNTMGLNNLDDDLEITDNGSEGKYNEEEEEEESKKVIIPKDYNPFVGKYISIIGRRKTSSAQVRLFENGKGIITVNGMRLNQFFPSNLLITINQPLKLTSHLKDINLSIIVNGGGKKGQVQAIRHGIVRALAIMDKDLRARLKAKGWITRDPRKKERKKPGLKKARRAPQWSKR